MNWDSVGGILHQGGTIIGTARSAGFRTREGRRQAAANLIDHEIDSLVVIGGDGSLTGANLFRQEWPELLAELLAEGQINAETAARHPNLGIVGLVGSIDNDMYGTDMTIGADTALHRITEAIDAISQHRRQPPAHVRRRGHGPQLRLPGPDGRALATGADWVLDPREPADVDNWEETDVRAAVQPAASAGRRDSIVVVAEGARDRHGNPIASDHVKQVLEEQPAARKRASPCWATCSAAARPAPSTAT